MIIYTLLEIWMTVMFTRNFKKLCITFIYKTSIEDLTIHFRTLKQKRYQILGYELKK